MNTLFLSLCQKITCQLIRYRMFRAPCDPMCGVRNGHRRRSWRACSTRGRLSYVSASWKKEVNKERHGYRQSLWARLIVTVCILFSIRWEIAWAHCGAEILEQSVGAGDRAGVGLWNGPTSLFSPGGLVRQPYAVVGSWPPEIVLKFQHGFLCLLSENMRSRVLLLQGGEIYCRTLLIPERGKETFFKGGGGVSGPLK